MAHNVPLSSNCWNSGVGKLSHFNLPKVLFLEELGKLEVRRFNQAVMITEVKQKVQPKQVQSVFTSSRTKQILQQACSSASNTAASPSMAHDVDPWHQSGQDPWNAWKPACAPVKIDYSKSTQGRLQEITGKLSDDVKAQVRQQIGEHHASTSTAIANATQRSQDAETRFRKLGCGLAEVTAQGKQFKVGSMTSALVFRTLNSMSAKSLFN